MKSAQIGPHSLTAVGTWTPPRLWRCSSALVGSMKLKPRPTISSNVFPSLPTAAVAGRDLRGSRSSGVASWYRWMIDVIRQHP
jgi:hypothetical protein